MEYKKLNEETMEQYLDYLKSAMKEEPEEMLTEEIDENAIRKRILDPFFQNKSSILALSGNQVIGRIEYHFYGCIQDGYKMAYVDWLYVLPTYRHNGIAQGLFNEFEKDCAINSIDQYYLIRATNKNADKFYKSLSDGILTEEPILRKTITRNV